MISSMVRFFNLKISCWYKEDLLIAAEKILGFVVTPETDEDEIRCASEPDSILSRERSSSQIDTPAFETLPAPLTI
jgi:hypothetical protein